MDTNMQFTINSFRQLFPDKIIFPDNSLIFSEIPDRALSNSLTFPGFPDKWSPCLRFADIRHTQTHWKEYPLSFSNNCNCDSNPIKSNIHLLIRWQNAPQEDKRNNKQYVTTVVTTTTTGTTTSSLQLQIKNGIHRAHIHLHNCTKSCSQSLTCRTVFSSCKSKTSLFFEVCRLPIE